MTTEESLSLERQGFFVSRYQHLNAELPLQHSFQRSPGIIFAVDKDDFFRGDNR